MREYINLLAERKKVLLIKYVILKLFLVVIIFAYYLFLLKYLSSDIWKLSYNFFVLVRDLMVIVLLFVTYAMVYVAFYVVGASPSSAYLASISIIASIVKINPVAFESLIAGQININPVELIVATFAVIFLVSTFLNIGFIVRGELSQFMWAMTLILFSLVGLEMLGYAHLAVYSWPPKTLGELLGNSIVIIAALTFFVIEVCGNVSYATLMLDKYIRKILRLSGMLKSLLYGKITSEGTEKFSEGSTVALRFSPLAEILLRGYTGVFALEETGSEIASKVMGFISAEGQRDKSFSEMLLGIHAEPKLVAIIVSIFIGLLVKLPLSILLTVSVLAIIPTVGSVYPGVIETQSPIFSLYVFIIVMVLMYLLGLVFFRKKIF